MLRFFVRWVGACCLVGTGLGCAATGSGSGFAASGTTAASGSSSAGVDATGGSSASSGLGVPPGNNDDGGLVIGTGSDASSGASCPSTCAQLSANCGAVFDTVCGGVVQCGGCDAGVCGAVTKNICGTGTPGNPDGSSTCAPMGCAEQGITCGLAGDGCGHMLDCGNPCALPQTCGGAKPGVCGCSGVCAQIQACTEAGGPTTLTGVVMDPGGINPLYNALVYIPNNPTDPALTSPLKDGVTCDVCGASAAGTPLVTTHTKTDGTFSLGPVPVGSNITLVVQLGRWRRLFQVNVPTACGTNVVAGMGAGGSAIQAGILTMPKNKTEGDIPLTAVITGDADALECVFWKMGVDPAEFTNPGGTGRIQLAYGSGFELTNGVTAPGRTDERGWINTCTATGGPCSTCPGKCTLKRYGGGAIIDANTPSESVLYQINGAPAVNPITNYALTIFSCQGWPWNMGTQPVLSLYPQLISYANSGGRIFASHFSSAYYTTGAAANAFDGTATWGGAPGFAADPTGKAGFVDLNPADNPKGAAFAAWLGNPPSALSPTPAAMMTPASDPTVTITQAKTDTTAVIPPTQQWMFMSPADDYANFSPLLFTFNTPIGAANTAQCGRGLFSDFHVSPNTALFATTMLNGTHGLVFPAECGPRSPMTAQEKVLEFILFDLGACVQPYQPICAPTTCAAQNIQCGAAGDGCGGALDCHPCPPGQSCVRGMCTAIATCTPIDCAAQMIQCGPAGDGCGNAIDCGPCPVGQICGFSGPGKCGGTR